MELATIPRLKFDLPQYLKDNKERYKHLFKLHE